MREARWDSFSGFSPGIPRRHRRKITQIEKKVYQQSPDTEELEMKFHVHVVPFPSHKLA
jgi:hypothetical protein